MGNAVSRQAGSTSTSIEAFYAARAATEAKLKANGGLHTENTVGEVNTAGEEDTAGDENASLLDENYNPLSLNLQQMGGEVDGELANTNSSDSPRSGSAEWRIKPSLHDPADYEARRALDGSFRVDHVPVDPTRFVPALGRNSEKNFNTAIEALRKIDWIEVKKAICVYVKDHPGEVAAMVVPLILLACTPAILGAVGFTAGGIAAGSIAAGIQAGIGGSVAAGSTFAVLTSAAMCGYGLPIVFGTVWSVSSAVGWGICAWKKYGNAEMLLMNIVGVLTALVKTERKVREMWAGMKRMMTKIRRMGSGRSHDD